MIKVLELIQNDNRTQRFKATDITIKVCMFTQPKVNIHTNLKK